MRYFAVTTILAVAIASTATPSLAQTDDESAVRTKVMRLIGSATTRSTMKMLVDRVMRQYERQDVDGGGITASDATLSEELNAASRRASRMQRYIRLDLNGDGILTREEGERALKKDANKPLRSAAGNIQPTPDQVTETLRRLMEQRMPKDANGDGKVTLVEMYAAANALATRRKIQSRYAKARMIGMEFDANKDKIVQRAEVEQATKKVVAAFDTDKNGEFSVSEVAKMNAEIRKARRTYTPGTSTLPKLPPRPLRCDLPPMPQNAEVAVLTGNLATSMATVAFGSPDQLVGVVDIRIEPGDKKLVLFTGSYRAMVFRMSGAVDRVARIVAPTRHGFTGIQENVIYWSDCRLRYSTRPSRQKQQVASLSDRLKMPVAHDIGSFRIGTIAVPSGTPDPIGLMPGAVRMDLEGDADKIWQRFRRLYKGGLVHVPAKDIIAKNQVLALKDMPQMAGLALLVQDGSLKLVSEQGNKVTLEIMRAVTMPPGLRTMFGWRFVKRDDVPMPTFTGRAVKIETVR